MINLDALRSAPLVTDPFPYMAASDVLSAKALSDIARDFPPISAPGVFPLSELPLAGAFQQLIEAIQTPALEQALAEKFSLDLSDLPLMVTVRGYCQKKDGRIHTDSKDKVLTCLLYLNQGDWTDSDGRLRLLRDGQDLDSVIAEIPPLGGNFVAFQRTDRSWHGHRPFVGPRRYVMVNWLRSDLALAKNIGRHKLSALFKHRGGSYGL